MADLRRLAEAATPGPWTVFGGWDASVAVASMADRERTISIIAPALPWVPERIQPRLDADAIYIAAASPDVILALLDRAEQAESTVERLRVALGDISGRCEAVVEGVAGAGLTNDPAAQPLLNIARGISTIARAALTDTGETP